MPHHDGAGVDKPCFMTKIISYPAETLPLPYQQLLMLRPYVQRCDNGSPEALGVAAT